jgi:hypothetical protein
MLFLKLLVSESMLLLSGFVRDFMWSGALGV